MKTSKDIKHIPTREIIELIEVWQKVDNDFEFIFEVVFRDENVLLKIKYLGDSEGLKRADKNFLVEYESGEFRPYGSNNEWVLQSHFENSLPNDGNSYISKNNLQSIFYYSNNNLSVDFPNTSNGFIYGLHRIVDGKSKDVVSEVRMTECAAMIDLAIKVCQDA